MTNTATTPTAAQQFAAAQLDGLVPAMLKAVKFGKTISYLLMSMVLLATYPHVGRFLSTVPHVGWLGWVIPGIFGGGLLAMYHVAQTPGLHAQGRKRAYVMVAAIGTGEVTMQLAAPGALGIKMLFGSLVGVGLGVKWAASAIRPDVAAITAAESAAAAQLAEVAPAAPAKAAGRTCPTGCTCRKHTRTALAKTTKAPAVRKPRAARTAKATTEPPATVEAMAAAMAAMPDAPVSPAVGRVTPAGLLIARSMDDVRTSY